MNTAFDRLKEAVKQDLELAFPDYTEDAEPLELWVDASGKGSGATLGQKQGGETRIIAYASIAFSKVQQNYSTTERELAAIRWGVKTFKAFLYGSKFKLYTDHQPLLYLNNMRIVDSRIARTLEDLADFDFDIVYIPGKSNVAADALSRLYSHDIPSLTEINVFNHKIPEDV